MTVVMQSIQNIALLFPEERPVFLREVNNNMYSVSAYFFGKIISELPSSFILPTLLSILIYWSLGFNTVDSSKWFIFGKPINC